MKEIKSHEITPEHVYFSRRKFLVGAGALLASTLIPAACKGQELAPAGSDFCVGAQARKAVDELGAKLTSCEDITHYNNYYEFSFDKEDVGDVARNFKTSPWTLKVVGMVNKPLTIDVDDLIKKYTPEERIYRMRCVEGWSMVIPWLGFPLAKLLKEVEPASGARYLRFETLFDPAQMPGQRVDFACPYAEGLRLDEAMHSLTILATGIYGKPLPPQVGAPIRLVMPWKYGFKNIKSIVKIDLVAEMPKSFWMTTAPEEYGFYANVNPEVPHPRWSQSSERRIGETARIKTMLFNGYEPEVASLYQGMDLRKFF